MQRYQFIIAVNREKKRNVTKCSSEREKLSLWCRQIILVLYQSLESDKCTHITVEIALKIYGCIKKSQKNFNIGILFNNIQMYTFIFVLKSTEDTEKRLTFYKSCL